MHLALLVMSTLLMAVATPRPPWVLKEFPPAGSTPIHVETIGAELNLAKVERVEPASLQLVVDGVDVTPRSTITLTRDWPPSFVSISYTPSQLQPGAYHAEIRVRAGGGSTLHYPWAFTFTPP